ncbi:right-handed parallel beta-helix repeat-containing protein [Pullulanibacillus sp. KACC 23026]|uniref:right-handed parallel beta-helix repeat-containing protein n=1 Tax=Pullulanibacillus sp. KACC 23026 TaxID=3028315 RepID=UPI0023B02B5E|nr:right-handed parallel beta-helix repeat-containing protein [Pullulanibacillus sp. KACC 23026]WEG12191.1 right-handed parallel beta-helix repeat-containing protein [Pullulanibacillus sp. KACC 23026]
MRLKVVNIMMGFLLLLVGGLGMEKVSASESVNLTVLDFGANGSDSVDDTANLQAALDAAQKYRSTTITVPDGTYLISKALKIHSNTHLILSSHAVIKRNAVFGPMLRNERGGPGYTGDHDIVIEGGTWDGNGQALSGKHTFDNLEFGHASNVTVKNTNVLNDYGAHAIEFVGVQNGQVLNSTINGYFHDDNFAKKEAIQLDITHNGTVSYPFGYYDDTPCRNITIQGNTIENYSRGVGSHTTVKGVYPQYITIQNNSFKNLTDEAVDALKFKDLSILNNTFENVGTGIYFITVPSNPKANYSPDNPIVPIYTDNHYAINITGNRFDSVHKIPGRVGGKGIVFLGTSESSIEDVSIENNTIHHADGDGIYLAYTSQTVIKGNNVQSSKEYGLAIHHYSNDVKVDSNTITNNHSHGISVYANANASITNNIIRDNLGSGISISTHSSSNEVDSNKIGNNGNYGIVLYRWSNLNTISHNVITQSKYGIGVNSGSNQNQLKNNTIMGSQSHGVKLYGSSSNPVKSNVISGNTISNSGQDGLYLVHANGTEVSRNKVTGANLNGISVTNHSTAKLIKNKISKSKGHGIKISSSSKSFVGRNNSVS